MATFDSNDDLFNDPPEDGGDGRSEFPFSVPDDDPFDLDWAEEDGLSEIFPLEADPALDEVMVGQEEAAFASETAVVDDVAIDDEVADPPFIDEPVSIVEAPRDEAPPEGGRKKSRKETLRRGSTALGVYVTDSTIYGTLLQPTADGVRVLRRFVRQRNAGSGDMSDLSGVVADTVDSDDDGVAIQFGHAEEVNDDLFMDSEFGDIANFADIDESIAATRGREAPFVFELKDLLDECSAIGHDKPTTAFCVGSPVVAYVEVVIPEEKSRKDDKSKAGARQQDKKVAEKKKKKAAAEVADPGGQPEVKRERLLARLAEVYDDPFEKERVAFVPMTTRDGSRRFMAIVPTAADALGESLDLLREQSGMRSIPLRAADSEVSTLMGLARWAFPADPHENTAIVRVDSENTLVILLHGSELHHQEHMLSVTTLDGPDTICSRVLLQQDVQGVGTVHQVIVLSEEREDELVQGFAAFYPDARVAALRRGLAAHGLTPPPGQALLSVRSLPAVGVALRMLLERQKDSPFEQVNMLPKRLRRSRPKLDLFIAWHTLVVGIVLFFAVLFFVGVYFAQKSQISTVETQLATYPPEAAMTPQALQTRIDSLRMVHIQITQTLNTIDSLLIGSDRWSRSMTRLARSTASSGGTWVEQWSPHASGVQLSGYTVTRDQAVQFAERMNGSINSLSFDEIRSFPVYSYVVTVPMTDELPEVARYLRDQVDVASGSRGADPLGGALVNEEAGPVSPPQSE